MNQSWSLAILFYKLNRIERQARPKYKSATKSSIFELGLRHVRLDWHKNFLPPVQATGSPAGSVQALPAGHAVQLLNFPPEEYIPAGHGTGGLL